MSSLRPAEKSAGSKSCRFIFRCKNRRLFRCFLSDEKRPFGRYALRIIAWIDKTAAIKFYVLKLGRPRSWEVWRLQFKLELEYLWQQRQIYLKSWKKSFIYKTNKAAKKWSFGEWKRIIDRIFIIENCFKLQPKAYKFNFVLFTNFWAFIKAALKLCFL